MPTIKEDIKYKLEDRVWDAIDIIQSKSLYDFVYDRLDDEIWDKIKSRTEAQIINHIWTGIILKTKP